MEGQVWFVSSLFRGLASLAGFAAQFVERVAVRVLLTFMNLSRATSFGPAVALTNRLSSFFFWGDDPNCVVQYVQRVLGVDQFCQVVFNVQV